MSGVDKAAKEIHRTLKPGGTATVLIWTVMPHISVLQDAHWRTRGKDAPMPSLLPCEKQFTKDDLAKTLKSGGFVDVETRDLVIKIKMQDLEHWAQLAWSFLGTLPGPEQWLEHDEENWDEAIKIIIEGIKNHPLSVIGENGEFFMGFEGAFCVAKK
jgi:hypothetical protein